MSEKQKAIKRNAIIVFNGDVTDEDLKLIPKDFCGDIIVHGGISLVDDIEVSGSIYCEGNIDSCDIKVAGDLCCEGDIDSYDIEVAGNLYCEGDIDSYDIEVAGNFVGNGAEICLNNHTFTAKSLASNAIRIVNCDVFKINC